MKIVFNGFLSSLNIVFDFDVFFYSDDEQEKTICFSIMSCPQILYPKTWLFCRIVRKLKNFYLWTLFQLLLTEQTIPFTFASTIALLLYVPSVLLFFRKNWVFTELPVTTCWVSRLLQRIATYVGLPQKTWVCLPAAVIHSTLVSTVLSTAINSLL